MGAAVGLPSTSKSAFRGGSKAITAFGAVPGADAHLTAGAIRVLPMRIADALALSRVFLTNQALAAIATLGSFEAAGLSQALRSLVRWLQRFAVAVVRRRLVGSTKRPHRAGQVVVDPLRTVA